MFRRAEFVVPEVEDPTREKSQILMRAMPQNPMRAKSQNPMRTKPQNPMTQKKKMMMIVMAQWETANTLAAANNQRGQSSNAYNLSTSETIFTPRKMTGLAQ